MTCIAFLLNRAGTGRNRHRWGELRCGLLLILCLGLGVPVLRAQTDEGLKAPADSLTLEGKRTERLSFNTRKPEPALPEPDLTVNSQPLKYNPATISHQPDLVPLELKSANLPRYRFDRLDNNYLRLGVGRYWTTQFQAALANGRDAHWDYGADDDILAAPQGQVPFAHFGDYQGGGRLSYAGRKSTFYSRLHGQYYRFNNFVDSLLLRPVERRPEDWRDTLGRHNVRGELELGIRKNPDPGGFHYDIGLRVRYFGDNYSNREVHGTLLPRFSFGILDSLRGFVDSRLTVSSIDQYLTDSTTDSFQPMFFELVPGVQWRRGRLTARAALRINNLTRPDSSTTSVYPVIEAALTVLPKYLRLEAGLTGRTMFNQRWQMAETNPWLDPRARVEPTREKMRFHAGIQGGVLRIRYRAQLYFRSLGEMPVYFTSFDTTYLGRPVEYGRFQLYYDPDVQETGFSIQVHYEFQDKVRTGVEFDLRTFSMDRLPKNFQIPGMRTRVYCHWQPLSGLRTLVALNLIGSRTMGLERDGSFREEGLFADLNLEIDYEVLPRFSIFAEVNNLFSSTYYRWNYYQERPLDFRIGGTYSF